MSNDFLRQAQRDLLQQLKEKEQQDQLSLDEGAEQLTDAFKACSGSVLLLVDKVPEDGRGIRSMLPPLDQCLAPGWVAGQRLESAQLQCHAVSDLLQCCQ